MKSGLMQISTLSKSLCRVHCTPCSFYHGLRCLFSTKNNTSNTSNTSNTTNRIVYRSLSRDIHENLALEDWIFENSDLEKNNILLIWQSDPCVVIGRHQNPWTETNIPMLENEAVTLARRLSGGGAVYHDHGNLNLSFMMSRSRYDRRRNLQLVVDALTDKWDLDLSINCRDDIVLDKCYKISGTAAKLSRNKSYHHFTLLHSVERSKLSDMLSSPLTPAGDFQEKNLVVESRSTHSKPSSIENLQAKAPDMSFEQMLEAIAGKFLDNPLPLANQQSYNVIEDPLDERIYPGVFKIFDRLQTWDWRYGKTPKFSISMKTSPETQTLTGNDVFVVQVCATVEKGRLESLVMSLNDGTLVDLAYLNNLKGTCMKKENLRYFEHADLLLGSTFINAYPRLDARSLSNSLQDSLSQMFRFL